MKHRIVDRKFFRGTLALGYVLIATILGIISYLWYCEWQKIETLEIENRRIDGFR